MVGKSRRWVGAHAIQAATGRPSHHRRGDTSKKWYFAQLGKLCGNDADSLQSVKTLVSGALANRRPVMGILLLECLLLRAVLRGQESREISWVRSLPSRRPITPHWDKEDQL